MKPKTAKQITFLLRFTFGLVLAVCISVWCAQAKAEETVKKEGGKLSLTKVEPEVTPVSDYSGNFLERSTITGDWWGSRKNLYEHGVIFDAALTQVYQNVASGGGDGNDSTYTGLLEYGLNLDTGKLNLWPGGLFTFNAQTGFASNYPLGAGNISPTNFTEIYPTPNKPDTQLMEYYLTQPLSKKFGLVLGRVNAVNFLDKNRFANDPRNQFLNISLGNDPLYGAFISFSTYGVLGQWKINENFSISPAIYDASTQPGNYFNDLFDDWGFAAQADLDWMLSKDRGGALRVTGIYTNKETNSFDNPRLVPGIVLSAGPSEDIIINLPELETKSGNWIIALNVEQYLWTPSYATDKKGTVRTASFDFQEPGLGLFGRFSYTPEDRNAWNLYVSGGIGGRGIIPGRIYDRLGLGVYWLKESGDLDDLPGNLLEDEVGFEAFYNLALTPSTQLTFDLQWIASGLTEIDNPVVLGVRLFTQF